MKFSPSKIMNTKFPLWLLLIATPLLRAETPAGTDQANASRKDAASSPPATCCAALPSAAFTKNSIYQAEAAFTTDTGRTFLLGELRGRPVVIALFFASCGYACPLIVTDMQGIRAKVPAALRDRALFVLVSFDVARDTPAALARYRVQRRLDDQWVLLHGDADSVRELAALLGVKYKQDADGAFSHSNLITILNPEGEIVHQRAGLQGGLEEAALAVAGASPAGHR